MGEHDKTLGLVFIYSQRFSQAREVEIVTSRAVPVQVDGEPLLMNPFKLRLEYFNSAAMLTKKKTSCE